VFRRAAESAGAVGAGVRWGTDLVSELFAFVAAGVRPSLWRRAPVRRELFRQMRAAAVGTLPFVLVVGALAGVVVFMRVLGLLKLAGSSDELAPSLMLVLLRDPAPLVVNLLVIGRGGTAILVELAGLRAAGHDRLLCAHGIDLFRALVVPRTLALTLSALLLAVFFSAAALSTALLTAAVDEAAPMGPRQIVRGLARVVGWADALAFGVHAALPAAVSGLLACRVGLGHEVGEAEIARALPSYFTQSIVVLIAVSAATTLGAL
jgi:phospholipid/cholesterol/gamma-HCH transport system permease protein